MTAGSPWSLTPRASERAPVHERLAYDRRLTSVAGLILTAVGIQNTGKPPRFPVDVDIKRVERGTALRHGLCHNIAGRLQQFHRFGLTQARAWCLGVTTDPPKSFVGIDIANPGNKGLIEQTPLNGGPACAQPSRYLVNVETLLERIRGDVGHRTGNTINERG